MHLRKENLGFFILITKLFLILSNQCLQIAQEAVDCFFKNLVKNTNMFYIKLD